MNRLVGTSVAAFVAFSLLLLARPAAAQEPAKPGKEHLLLKELAGTWEATIKLNAEPGKPPVESKGTETSHLIGGLWLVSNFEGDMMGQKFTGHGIQGYDAAKKKYVGVWVDSMETELGVMEGDYDAASKKLTMTMDGKGPDGKPTKYKMVTTITGPDQHEFNISLPGPDGKDAVMMSISYKRKK